MRTIKIALTLSCALLFSGCSSLALEKDSAIAEQDNSIVTILTGKPVAFVKDRLGLPNQRSTLASGSSTWIYFDNTKGISGKGCKVSLAIRNDIIERVNISTSNSSFTSFFKGGCDRIKGDII